MDVIRLELRNNTLWKIEGVATMSDEFGGSGWCYLVTTDDTCRAPLFMGNCGDVLGPVTLGPGASLQLNVSPYHLSRGSAIETSFRFAWEPYNH